MQGITQDSLYAQPAAAAGSNFQVDIIDPDDNLNAPGAANVREQFVFDGDETIRVRFATPKGSFDRTFAPSTYSGPNVDALAGWTISSGPPTNAFGAWMALWNVAKQVRTSGAVITNAYPSFVRLFSVIEQQGFTNSVFNQSFAFGLIGQALPAADMPTSGVGSFAGGAFGLLSRNTPTGPEGWFFNGTSNISVNFATSVGAVSGTITSTGYSGGPPAPPPIFVTTLAGDLNGSALAGTTATTGLSAAALPGTFQGQIYGVKSQPSPFTSNLELGAVFQARNQDVAIVGGLIAGDITP
ncbi:MAG: hypothetical protein AB7M12_02050 [Hyphomonadaceae bacterium]